MKRWTVKFDAALALVIGKLPKELHRPFHMLGVITMPIAWASAVGVVAIFDLARTESYHVSLLVLLLIPLASIMKLFIRRKRPPTIYADAMKIKTYSFPSGHAYSAALAGGYLAVLAFGNNMAILGTALILLVGVIGLSRVHLGAHYPSDVLAGWTLGAGVLLLTLSAT